MKGKVLNKVLLYGSILIALVGGGLAIRYARQSQDDDAPKCNAGEVIAVLGGYSLIFEIRTNEMALERLRATRKELQAKLDKAVADNDQAERERLRRAIEDVEEQITGYEEAGDDPSDLAERTVAILKNRIDPDGLRCTEWRPMGKNRFEVRMPAGQGFGPAEVKRFFSRPALLEFRIVPYLPVPQRNYDLVVTEQEYQEYKKLLADEGPEGVRKRNGKYVWLPIDEKAKKEDFPDMPVVKHADGRDYILVFNQEGFVMLHEAPPTGWRVIRARPRLDGMGRPAVSFDFDKRGAQLFAKLTEGHRARDEHTGHALALIVNDKVYSAPAIKTKIFGRAAITGRFSKQEVEELARALEVGALPVRINPVPISETYIPPAKGKSGGEE